MLLANLAIRGYKARVLTTTPKGHLKYESYSILTNAFLVHYQARKLSKIGNGLKVTAKLSQISQGTKSAILSIPAFLAPAGIGLGRRHIASRFISDLLVAHGIGRNVVLVPGSSDGVFPFDLLNENESTFLDSFFGPFIGDAGNFIGLGITDALHGISPPCGWLKRKLRFMLPLVGDQTH